MLPICYPTTLNKKDFNSLANSKRTIFATSFFNYCIKLLGCLGVGKSYRGGYWYIYNPSTFFVNFKALTSLRSLQNKLKNLQGK